MLGEKSVKNIKTMPLKTTYICTPLKKPVHINKLVSPAALTVNLKCCTVLTGVN